MKQKDLDAINDPKTYQPGAGRDPKNLRYWSGTATSHSEIAPRASDGEMKLPDTSKGAGLRPTTMAPREQRKIDKAMRGEDPAEKNHVGESDYMRGVRRHT